MADSKIIIGDWSIKGRSEILRQLCEFLCLPYQNKIYTDPNEWFLIDKPFLKSDFPNVPYILDGDKVITETEACALYIISKSNKLELGGSDLDEVIYIAQVIGVIADLTNNFTKVAFNKEADLEKGIEEACIPKLMMLSKHLGDREWLIGKISIADFFFVRILGLISMNVEWLDEKFPNLATYLQRFRDLHAIKEYLHSDRNLKAPSMLPNMVNPKFKLF